MSQQRAGRLARRAGRCGFALALCCAAGHAEEPGAFRQTPAFDATLRKAIKPGLTAPQVEALLGRPPLVQGVVRAEQALAARDAVVVVLDLAVDANELLRRFNVTLGPDGTRPSRAYDWMTLRDRTHAQSSGDDTRTSTSCGSSPGSTSRARSGR